jgi:DNA-binding transcriptional MocR family regulator
MKLYRVIAQDIIKSIRSGALRPGDPLPSVRSLCTTRDVSPATALRAYEYLEAQQLIEARPRSGYYVIEPPHEPLVPRPAIAKSAATRLNVSDLVFATLAASKDREVVPLGSAFPSPTLFPWGKLARFLGSSARSMDPWSTVESLPPGSLELRRQIARRYLRLGMNVALDEIVITAGALEGLNLALESVTRPGDTVAIESPAFYGCLQAVQRLGLKVVEIPTHPEEGLSLGALQEALDRHDIRAFWCMPTLHHPTGATLSKPRKQELARMLAVRKVPLIEDDAYSELQFGAQPSPPVKAFDEAGLVIHCGSFSKCLAPGYRLGWVAAGSFTRDIVRRKIETSIATSLPVQQGIAKMLRQGSYETHLSMLRGKLIEQQAAALDSIQRHFPAGYRITRPAGGYFLWIECAPGIDSLEVHRRALEFGITTAPGPIFSARQQYRNFLRLNCGHPWTAAMDRAVERLGQFLR